MSEMQSMVAEPATMPLEKKTAMKAERILRERERDKRMDSAPETDAHGIPFHKLIQHQAAPLAGMDKDGSCKYPLWTGKLMRGPDHPDGSEGDVMPHIVMAPIASNINGGKGTEFYKSRKGFKEVAEIPDAYAEYRDPYLIAIASWQAKESEAVKVRKQLVAAGVKFAGDGGRKMTVYSSGIPREIKLAD